MTENEQYLIGRRGELLAELFLQDLQPRFVAQTASDNLGVDFFVGFDNGKGGVNLVSVEVKATQQLSGSRFHLPMQHYALLANSNVPGLIVVVDVKQNRCYYAIANAAEVIQDRQTISFPLIEGDEAGRKALIDRLVR